MEYLVRHVSAILIEIFFLSSRTLIRARDICFTISSATATKLVTSVASYPRLVLVPSDV